MKMHRRRVKMDGLGLGLDSHLASALSVKSRGLEEPGLGRLEGAGGRVSSSLGFQSHEAWVEEGRSCSKDSPNKPRNVEVWQNGDPMPW